MQCMYKYNRFTLMSQDLHILKLIKLTHLLLSIKEDAKLA